MSQPSHTSRVPRSELGTEYAHHISRRGTDPGELTTHATESDLLAVAYRGRFLPSPVFVTTEERASLAADLRMAHTLLTGLPERLFDGDLGALARVVGMTPTQVSVVERAARSGGSPLPLARSDLYRDAEGFKLLELNISSALGGFENADINRAMLRHPALGEFVDKHDLGYVDTLRGIVDTMLAECAAHLPQGRRPVVALADWPESYASYEPRLRVMAELLAGMGIDAIPCHVGQIRERGGRLEAHGRTIDVVYRFFLVEEIVTEDDAALVEPVLRAVEQGAVSLFCRFDSELYGNKGALALLSDDRHRASFTAQERACIDRFLPWTRPVRRVVTAEDGSEREVRRYAMEEQHELILKPTLLHGGEGIIAGWTVTAEEWRARVAQALDQPYVLQRRVRPLAEPFLRADGQGCQDFFLNWGVFLADPAATGGDGYGGCIVRGSADPGVGIVSMSGGARVGCTFHESPEPV
ncbi:hypothetical protein ACWGCW_06320 [Streptomyces sp. NPDC054933]